MNNTIIYSSDIKYITTRINNDISRTYHHGRSGYRTFFHNNHIPPNVPRSFIRNIENVMDLFDDPQRYMVHLGRLEALLVERAAQEEVLIQTSSGSYKLKQTQKSFSCFKLLSSVLHDIAKRNGFTGIHKIEPQSGILSKSAFFSILKEKKLVKDVGAFPAHGEWEHAIQWFCIISEYESKPNFLSVPPAELYRQLGLIGDNDHGAAWFILFESRVTSYMEKYAQLFERAHVTGWNTLSSVNKVFNIIQANPKLPLLTELLTRREAKRVKAEQVITLESYPSLQLTSYK